MKYRESELKKFKKFTGELEKALKLKGR